MIGIRACSGILSRTILQPTHPARRAVRSERLSALDGGKGKGKPGDENQRSHGPCGQIVVQDVEVRRAVFEDGALHLGVCGVDDFAAERFGLALQLEGGFTSRTDIVDCGGAVSELSEARRFASRAEEICCAP